MSNPNLEQPIEGGRLAPRDIVRRRIENAWDLALVQRDEVWKEDRIRLLLDSLIMGYPVGSLLFCQIDRPGMASIPLGGGQAAVRQAETSNPQLVDGQQRVFAIYSIFTGRGYGRFYLNAFRDPSRDAGYILWRRFDPVLDTEVDGFNEREAEPIADRDRYVDLSNWLSLGELIEAEIDNSRVAAVVSILDYQFRLPDDATARTAIAARLESVRAAWLRKSIPMISASVRDPEDVLEVFSRVNRGGAPVSGNDLYFAAVKTFWHDPELSAPGETSAHAALKGIADATGGLLDVYGALSLLSRLALAGIGLSDMVPVNVDRLSKANKRPILRSMKSTAPLVAKAVQRFTAVLHEHTRMGYALKMTRTQLWEDVFGWVVASDAEREWTEGDISQVEEYVLGATLFGYQQVLGDAFRRDAFAVALNAGSAGREFPTREIIGVAHGRYPKLKRGRQQVRGLLNADERLEVARSAPHLLVAFSQQLPLGVGSVDWDHVVAAENQSRFRLPPGFGRRYAPTHTYLNWPGNFWFLDSSANRSVQEMPPREKFVRLREWALSDPRGKGRIGPDLNAGISGAHLKAFEALGTELASLTNVADAPRSHTRAFKRSETRWLNSSATELHGCSMRRWTCSRDWPPSPQMPTWWSPMSPIDRTLLRID
ncbi:DUF262 domain-containing protein [Microbacterium sp.]|uniref:DUF262 domain-containing protein n=1 Tax=Microbacterium sp. TaxID=51671 RepID=UPI0025CDF0AC|nr:DUF262 domain-containing protein [Microbacterium sp.]